MPAVLVEDPLGRFLEGAGVCLLSALAAACKPVTAEYTGQVPKSARGHHAPTTLQQVAEAGHLHCARQFE